MTQSSIFDSVTQSFNSSFSFDEVERVLVENPNWTQTRYYLKSLFIDRVNKGKLSFDVGTQRYRYVDSHERINALRGRQVNNTRSSAHKVPWNRAYNLYEYSYKYLVEQTMSLKLVSRVIAEAEIDSYANISNVDYDLARGNGQIQALYKELATTLQTGYNMPSIIRFLSRVNDFSDILFAFDPNEVLAHYSDWNELYQALNNRFSIAETNKKSWEKYTQGLYSGAIFLAEFHDKTEFDEFINSFPENEYNPHRYDYPTYADNVNNGDRYRVLGMAYVLSCNFLKECGHLEYIKPDTHVMDVCTQLGLCPPKNSVACQAACRVQAGKAGVSPYALDKVIWLCCSGQYYRTSVVRLGSARLKKSFIKELKNAVAAGILVL